MVKTKLAVKYAFFAALATLGNIGTQHLCLKIYGEKYALYVAMFAGTFIGLVIKYILDKKYIFNYQVESKKEDLFKFILYSLMGVVTTAVFWGTEIAFDALFPFEWAKYIGAVLGLFIGYTSKYFLDKKYVFKK